MGYEKSKLQDSSLVDTAVRKKLSTYRDNPDSPVAELDKKKFDALTAEVYHGALEVIAQKNRAGKYLPPENTKKLVDKLVDDAMARKGYAEKKEPGIFEDEKNLRVVEPTTKHASSHPSYREKDSDEIKPIAGLFPYENAHLDQAVRTGKVDRKETDNRNKRAGVIIASYKNDRLINDREYRERNDKINAAIKAGEPVDWSVTTLEQKKPKKASGQ